MRVSSAPNRLVSYLSRKANTSSALMSLSDTSDTSESQNMRTASGAKGVTHWGIISLRIVPAVQHRKNRENQFVIYLGSVS